MEKIVGTFVICVFFLLLSMVVMIGRGKDWFKKNVIYYTSFGESYNLDKSSPVKLFNADIGKVKKINLVGNRVEITLAIYQEYAARITSDSVASVEGITYIGKKHISIKPGRHDSELIPEGGRIPSEEKASISDILDEFEIEKTAKMVIKSIQDLSELTHLLKDPKGPLISSLNSINVTLSEVESRIGAILENVLLVSSKVPGTVDQAHADLKKVQAVTEALLVNIATLKRILENVEEGSRDVPPVTKSTKEGIHEIRSAVKNIDEVVQSLQKNILIRSHIPPEPEGDAVDAGLR